MVPTESIQPRIWSYDSLRYKELWIPVESANPPREDRTRISTVALPYYSPEHGPGLITPRAPQRRDLGEWLYGLMARFDQYYEAHHEHQRKVDRVFESFVDFDAAPRDWKRAVSAATKNGHAALHSQRLQHEAVARRRVAQHRLAAFNNVGLERREGERLHGEENTWIHLIARGFSHPGLRVCEQCALVFRAQRARRCLTCRRSPVRIKLHPLKDGGWHVDYRVGNRWASETFERSVYYTTVCRGCDARFETKRPDGKYCRNCRGNSGRSRRHRGGSRTGRQRFRFRHAEGITDWSISFNTLNGQAVHLEAIDGVIETDDAEIAKALESRDVRPDT
jgi:hypothetical protein